MKKYWWKETFIYQIYPTTFYDSNNDGIGDLKGIAEKLEYIKSIGINAIWISPFYQSPMFDNGYDVSDYYKIDKIFGTMKDFDNLMKKAKQLDIKVVIDVILNHVSWEHEWFKKAIKGNKKYQDYFYFYDKPINNFNSIFGGSAWTYVKSINKYYFHAFAKQQPDLNWKNPDMINEIYNMLNFWIKKGVSGFRLDAIALISKDLDTNQWTTNRIHSMVKEMRKNTWKDSSFLTVAEAGGDVNEAILYTKESRKEFSQVFTYEHVNIDDDKEFSKWSYIKPSYKKIKDVLISWQEKLEDNDGWATNYFENHDQPRIISRWADGIKNYKLSSSVYFAILTGFKGTSYIYQGQEIGMSNIKLNDIKEFKDIEVINWYKELVVNKKQLSKSDFIKRANHRSRDNSRTVMPWYNTLNAGFSKHKKLNLLINKNYNKININDQLKDKTSPLNTFKKLSFLKNSEQYKDILNYGTIKFIKSKDEIIHFYRQNNNDKIYFIINLANYDVEIKNIKINQILFNNYKKIEPELLKKYQVIIYK